MIMEEKKINELTDEELNQAAGGAGKRSGLEKAPVQCCDCGYTWETYPRVSYTCKKCGSTDVRYI